MAKGRLAICSEADLVEAQAIAWRLCRPSPSRSRTATKPHGAIPHRVIAAELGVSTERCRQIEKAALAKCRAWCDQHGYSLADMLRRL